MKLSDVKGERTLDVIAEILDPVIEIAGDPESAELFGKKSLPEGMTENQYFLQRVRKSVPALLKAHKHEIIMIFSAIEGVSPEEYAEKLNLVTLTKDCFDLLTDSTFVELFTSALSSPVSSGSAPENIVA